MHTHLIFISPERISQANLATFSPRTHPVSSVGDGECRWKPARGFDSSPTFLPGVICNTSLTCVSGDQEIRASDSGNMVTRRFTPECYVDATPSLSTRAKPDLDNLHASEGACILPTYS